MNGYIVLIDFSKFFPNCSHEVINSIHNKYINDSYTKKVIEDYLYVKDIGIALGVEIAQREALMVPNKLDTFITNLGYPIIRYMDDTFFICPISPAAFDAPRTNLPFTINPEPIPVPTVIQIIFSQPLPAP